MKRNYRKQSRKSTVFVSNIDFDESTSILRNERLASAIVDRPLHHMQMMK